MRLRMTVSVGIVIKLKIENEKENFKIINNYIFNILGNCPL